MIACQKTLFLLSALALAPWASTLLAQGDGKTDHSEAKSVTAEPTDRPDALVVVETPNRVAKDALPTKPGDQPAPAQTPATGEITHPRLYAMPCGTAHFGDFGAFSDTGEYEGLEQSLVTSCYLIRHPMGDLLWDLGLGDDLSEFPEGLIMQGGQIQLKVDNPLLPQLAQINVYPEDVEYIAFSHLHFDHTGNANAFTRSTWLMNEQEWVAARAQPTPFGVEPKHLSAHKKARLHMITGDHDVFGDGSVRILAAPGHTPGHQVLMVQLNEFGTVILSGDLYHTRENRTERRIPAINHDRADTLASMDRVEQWVRNRKAMFVIQHVPEDLRKLPVFPGYLD